MTVQVMVIAVLSLGLVMALLTVKIKHMAVILPVMNVMVVIVVMIVVVVIRVVVISMVEQSLMLVTMMLMQLLMMVVVKNWMNVVNVEVAA